MSDHLKNAELEYLREVLHAAAPMKSDHGIRIAIADYLRIVNPHAVIAVVAEVVALRGALQALVDALDALEIYSPDTPSAVSVVTRLTAARAVAVAVLTEGGTDG